MLALLNSRLVQETVTGDVQERIYRGFGLTLRFRRKLAQVAVAEAEAEAAREEAVATEVAPAAAPEPEPRRPAEPKQIDFFDFDHDPAVSADLMLPVLAASMEEGSRGLESPPDPSMPKPPGTLYPALSGKTAAVIGFPPEQSSAIGRALAEQFCSFLFLNHADAEFRKGSTNGCDLLMVSAMEQWTATGSLHPGSLLSSKKPTLMFGEREILAKLAGRTQGTLRELVPAPWTIEDAMWRAATLLGREPNGRSGKKGTHRKRVVIGDESAARALVHGVLAQEGMDCFVAANGADALALAHTKQADAVIVDVSLPGLDGFQVLAEIRRDPVLKNAIVILLTDRQAEADVLRGFGLGANDYITRPFSPLELAARLKRFLVKKP